MVRRSSPTPEEGVPAQGAPSTGVQELVMPRPPGVFRRFWARHPWLTDSLIVAFYGLFVLLTIWANFVNYNTSVAEVVVHIAVVAVSAAALLLRRRNPLIPLAVGAAITLIIFPGYGQGNLFAVIIALYAVAVYRSARAAWISFALTAATSSMGAWLAGVAATTPALTVASVASASTTEAGERLITWPVVSLQYTFALLLATLIGSNIGNRRRYLGALIDRAAQLARERDQQATIAAATERSRIAREMHDVVAHSLSIVVSLADGAAAIVPRDPDRAQAAMLSVGETGRQALAEMRRLLGVLGSADAQPALLTPQPGLDQLHELIDQFRAAALPVEYTTTGIRPTDEGLQLALYRIVQESLTNALRYAGSPTRVIVDLDYTGDRVHLVVTDDGRDQSPNGVSFSQSLSSRSGDGGRGLIGIRDRAALFGGSASAGPRAGGGWRVSATIPLTGTL